MHSVIKGDSAIDRDAGIGIASSSEDRIIAEHIDRSCSDSDLPLRLSVIIPTYNERENIDVLIERLQSVLNGLEAGSEIIIVDDNSPDGTAAVAGRYVGGAAGRTCVSVLLRHQDPGLAKSVAAGFEIARGRTVMVMDADLSHPPELIPQLLEAVESGSDMAVASRYVAGGGTEGWPRSRQWISRAACLLARPLSPVKDITSGYFAIRKSALERLDYHPRGYKIGLELLAQPGIRATEVPFTFHDRSRGESKLGATVILAYLLQLASLYRSRYPSVVGYLQFGMVGLLGMAVDALVFAFSYWYVGLNSLGAELGGFLAQALSFIVAMQFNYTLNRYWTFRERSAGANFVAYAAVNGLGFLLRSVVFEVLILSLPVAQGGMWIPPEQIALFAGIVASSLWNFWGSRRWAFPVSSPSNAHVKSIIVTQAWVGIALLGALVMRLWVAAVMPLTFDEAYYWQWSRHPDWSYFDHPPMIAYAIAAGTRWFGDTALGVRLLPALMTIGIAWMVYRLALHYWRDQRIALIALLMALVMPLFAVGGMLATPDIPLLFFWVASLLLLVRALESNQYYDWLLMGLCAGLGLLSKLPMTLFYLGAFFALLSFAKGRATLRTPRPWIALTLSLFVALPYVIWEVQHGFASFGFHFQQGTGQLGGQAVDSLNVAQLLTFIAGQTMAASPLLFAFLVLGLLKPATCEGGRNVGLHLPQISSDAMRQLLLWPAVVTLSVFSLASLLGKSNPNWTAPAYLSAIVLAAGMVSCALQSPLAGLKRAAQWGFATAAGLSLYVIIEACSPMLAFPHLPKQFPVDQKPLAAWVDGLVADERDHGSPPFIYASNYKLASVLGFYMTGHPETQAPFERQSGSAYLEWMQKAPPGSRALYISNHPHPPELQQLFPQGPEELGEFTITRLNKPLYTVYGYVGELGP